MLEPVAELARNILKSFKMLTVKRSWYGRQTHNTSKIKWLQTKINTSIRISLKQSSPGDTQYAKQPDKASLPEKNIAAIHYSQCKDAGSTRGSEAYIIHVANASGCCQNSSGYYSKMQATRSLHRHGDKRLNGRSRSRQFRGPGHSQKK